MHIKDLSPFHISEFGLPQVQKSFGLSYAKYRPGQIPGWKIAKRLHVSGLLTDAGKKVVRAINPASEEDWGQVAEAEGIPVQGYTPPQITEYLEALPRKARLSEITYDTDFTNTLYKVLESYALNTPGKSTVYPLLDGPPGASKSIVVMVIASLLGLPVYTVTGSDGAADEIKISLLGGDNANADTLLGLVKRYSYQGWLKNPLSLKELAIGLHTAGTLDAIGDEVFMKIAGYEKIRENITCYTPGAYQLASMHGGILFLDEINGFKGVTTVLTEILENYTVEQHPNFFIIGALNPAGEKHDRDPLPPEIRSRAATIYVKAPTVASYQHMLHYLFSGEQPLITLPNGKSGRVTPAITGYSAPPRSPSLLQKSLQPQSFKELIANIASFHKQVEIKYEEGTLNPRDSAVPTTMETTSVDRRMLVRGINALDTYLHLLQDPDTHNLSSGSTSYSDYFSAALPQPSKELIALAVTRMLERIYLDAFNFPIQEELEIEKNKKRNFTSGSEFVRAMINFCHLSHDELLKYLKTQQDVEKLAADWKKVLSTKYKITKSTEIDKIVAQSLEEDIAPNSKYYDVITPKDEAPQLISMSYLATKSQRADYRETFYPGLSLADKEATALLPILESRMNMLKSKNKGKRFATVEEYKLSTKFISAQREENKNAIYISFFPDDADNVRCSLMVPHSCFHTEVAQTLKRKQEETNPGIVNNFNSKVFFLKKDGKPQSNHKLLAVLNDVFQGVNGSDRLTIEHITEIIPFDVLVNA